MPSSSLHSPIRKVKHRALWRPRAACSSSGSVPYTLTEATCLNYERLASSPVLDVRACGGDHDHDGERADDEDTPNTPN